MTARKKTEEPKKKVKKVTTPKNKEVKKDTKSKEKTPKSKKPPKLLRGMKDIQPKHGYLWQKLYKTAEGIADAYGFDFVETPILEEASLFVRSIGKGTDVVDKEMYMFEDRDGTKVCLRPEGTASFARAYVNHGMLNMPQPVKAWYYGPMFRHDRPQAGRYRQFHQFSCESLGVRDPVIDAELISVAYNFLKDLGIESQVRMNSIGSLEDRQRYIIELVGYLRSKRSQLSEVSKMRLSKNPLRILDSKDEGDMAVVEDAPQILDWLSEDSKKYFMEVLEYLDDSSIPYSLDFTLVRGLDYYTDTVFELYTENAEGQQSALCGGGRYDKLVEQIGGQPTPGCGFSIGLERVLLSLNNTEAEGSSIKPEKPTIFFAQLGEQARRRTLTLIEDLRKKGIIVGHSLGKTSLKAQLEMANEYLTTHTVILGQKELQDGTIIIRDMESGIQEIIDQKKLGNALQKIIDTKNK